LAGNRQKVGTRGAGGCIESVVDVAVETLEDVSVDVEYGPQMRAMVMNPLRNRDSVNLGRARRLIPATGAVAL
jgi:hypothetical protein